jgi:hypothetical protein
LDTAVKSHCPNASFMAHLYFVLLALITHIMLVANGNERIPKGSDCTDTPSKQVADKMNN